MGRIKPVNSHRFEVGLSVIKRKPLADEAKSVMRSWPGRLSEGPEAAGSAALGLSSFDAGSQLAHRRERNRSLADIAEACLELISAVDRLEAGLSEWPDGSRRGFVNAVAATRLMEHIQWEWSFSSCPADPEIHSRWLRLLGRVLESAPTLKTAMEKNDRVAVGRVLSLVRELKPRVLGLEEEARAQTPPERGESNVARVSTLGKTGTYGTSMGG